MSNTLFTRDADDVTHPATEEQVLDAARAGDYRRLTCWEHESVLERMQARLERDPTLMITRRRTVEHAFGTIKAWMGAPHFLCRRLSRVSAEMSLHVLACNMKRVMKIMGTGTLIEALRA